jgi:hypothetical protein
MTPESKFKITFHRTYELDPSVIHSRLAEEGYEDVEMTEELMKEKAEEIARDYLADEMPMFVDNTPDFVSATVEVID